MKPQTFFIIFGVFILLAGIGVGVYFYITRQQDEKDKPTDENPGPAGSYSSTPSATNSTASAGKELKNGSIGEEVKQLQALINKTMTAIRVVSPNNVPVAITEDGKFGAKTEQALVFCTGKTSTTLANYPALVEASSKSSRGDLTPAQKQAMSKAASVSDSTLGFFNWLYNSGATPSTDSTSLANSYAYTNNKF